MVAAQGSVLFFNLADAVLARLLQARNHLIRYQIDRPPRRDRVRVEMNRKASFPGIR